MTGQPLDVLPMWALYVLTVLAMLVTMEGGYRRTRARQRKSPDRTDTGVDAMSGASPALLAFLLAFVPGFGTNIPTNGFEPEAYSTTGLGRDDEQGDE